MLWYVVDVEGYLLWLRHYHRITIIINEWALLSIGVVIADKILFLKFHVKKLSASLISLY